MNDQAERPDEYLTEDAGGTSGETGTTYDAAGEPEATPHDEEIAELNADSNPNAASSRGLEGDMGVSSERTEFGGIEDTGSVGSTAFPGTTDGTNPTTGQPTGPGSDEPTPASPEEDLTDIAPHENDPRRNPGHSHG